MFRYIEKESGSWLVGLEPGDATRYEFMVMYKDFDFVYVAGRPSFAMYEYRRDEILAAHSRLGDMPVRSQEALGDYFIGYIVEHSHCDRYTARAMIHGVAMTMLEIGGLQDHNRINEQIREY